MDFDFARLAGAEVKNFLIPKVVQLLVEGLAQVGGNFEDAVGDTRLGVIIVFVLAHFNLLRAGVCRYFDRRDRGARSKCRGGVAFGSRRCGLAR